LCELLNSAFPGDSETWSPLASGLKGVELLSAAGTTASKVNVVILDLETAAADIGPRELIEARVLQVEDVTAVQADEVMVLVELGVEPGGRARVTGLGHETEGDECPQNAMDRHPGDLGKSAAHCPVNLLGRGMVATVEDGFKHGPALGSDRQSALAMGGEEAVDPLMFFHRTHVLEMDVCTR
jgi:hypothetical protein